MFGVGFYLACPFLVPVSRDLEQAAGITLIDTAISLDRSTLPSRRTENESIAHIHTSCSYTYTDSSLNTSHQLTAISRERLVSPALWAQYTRSSLQAGTNFSDGLFPRGRHGARGKTSIPTARGCCNHSIK